MLPSMGALPESQGRNAGFTRHATASIAPAQTNLASGHGQGMPASRWLAAGENGEDT